MTPTDRFVSETTFYVRYAETDAMRIVHHSSYIVYFEEGRSDYMRQRGEDYARFEEGGHYLAVTDLAVRYPKAARYGQRLTVRSWIKAIMSRALIFQYEIVDAESGDVHVTGESKHVCINDEGKVTRIPDAWRRWSES